MKAGTVSLHTTGEMLIQDQRSSFVFCLRADSGCDWISTLAYVMPPGWSVRDQVLLLHSHLFLKETLASLVVPSGQNIGVFTY